MSDASMALPPGKTCGDCDSFERCAKFIGCVATNVTCDWAPSRFRPRRFTQADMDRAVAAEQSRWMQHFIDCGECLDCLVESNPEMANEVRRAIADKP